MTTLVIDRETLPEPIFSIMGASRIKLEGDAEKIVLTPATEADDDEKYIDPADYPDTTAYLNALPGVAERLLSYRSLPDSEFEDWS